MFMMLVTVAIVMSSCSKKDQTNTATQASTIASLPTKAANYVVTNYPDATPTGRERLYYGELFIHLIGLELI